jgi:hypothetical protein
MDWSGLLLLILLGHETESRVTSVSGNVLDQVNIYLRPLIMDISLKSDFQSKLALLATKIAA